MENLLNLGKIESLDDLIKQYKEDINTYETVNFIKLPFCCCLFLYK